MATAFSYSGTGLESAIQSGSGGIGTGSSITLEVDSVPSDVSQGDTVKVALGSASDWSGGNGETAYGDIGGAGANGGTNITLTSRGREGTTAASWSESDPVRVGVQGRDDVGPERGVAESQLIKPSKRLIAYDDFRYPDGLLGGRTLPTGQTWNDPGGDFWKTESDRAFADSNVAREAYIPYTPSEDTYYVQGVVNNAGSRQVGLVLAFQDTDNFLFVSVKSEASVFKVVGGTSSQIAQTGLVVPVRGTHTVKGGVNLADQEVYVSSRFGGEHINYSGGGDVDTILSNSIGVGLTENASSSSPVNHPVFENFLLYEPVGKNTTS
jgi:hypothetical protein